MRARAAAPSQPEPSDAQGTERSLFFSRVWIGGAVVVLLIGLLASQPALSLLALLVLATAGLAAGWNRLALRRVEYRRELFADRAFPDDVVTLTITVVNRKALPLPGLSIEDELDAALQPIDRETTLSGTSGRRILRIVTSVRAHEAVTWRIPLRCTARGVHAIGPATLRAGDPFGFFSTRRTAPGETSVLVYPRVSPLAELGFPPRAPLGTARLPRQLLTDPTRVIGVRDYQPDDLFRLIHWKATARLGTLQVRITEPVTTRQLAIFLNLDTFERYWEGLDVATAEWAIEVAAAIAKHAIEERDAVGIYANGIVAGSDQPLRVPPSRSATQLQKLMEGLARISPYSTVAFARILAAEMPRLPWGSTIVVVTSLVPESLIAQLSALLAAGHQVVLVTLGEPDVPMLQGLILHRIPLDGAAASDVAVATQGAV